MRLISSIYFYSCISSVTIETELQALVDYAKKQALDALGLDPSEIQFSIPSSSLIITSWLFPGSVTQGADTSFFRTRERRHGRKNLHLCRRHFGPCRSRKFRNRRHRLKWSAAVIVGRRLHITWWAAVSKEAAFAPLSGMAAPEFGAAAWRQSLVPDNILTVRMEGEGGEILRRSLHYINRVDTPTRGSMNPFQFIDRK